MARREYRDVTGKLLGISQSESDRTGGKAGKIGFVIVLVISGISALFSHKPDSASHTSTQQQSPTGVAAPPPVPAMQAPPVDATSSPATGAAIAPDAPPTEQAHESAPSSGSTLPMFVIAKATSLFDLDESLPISLKPLAVGTKVLGIDSPKDGWEHVRIPNADESHPDEDGYVPMWALEAVPQRTAPPASSP